MLTPTIGQGPYGSDLVVDRMQRDDIPDVALNPDSTFRGLHDSLVNYGGNTPEIVLAQHDKVAMQEPQGPVYLCYDAAFQGDPLDGEHPLPALGRVSAGTRMQADPAALDRLAEWLLTAQQPVILAGYLGRHRPSFHRLVELAEATGAAVVDLHNRLNFPTTHPLNITAAATGVLSAADLVLALDVKDLYGPLTSLDRVARRTQYITPTTCRIVEIGFRDVRISK